MLIGQSEGWHGQSTLARQLTDESEPSLIVDRDPQRTTTKWWTRRAQIEPAFTYPELTNLDDISLNDVAKQLGRKLEEALFIDTRPAVEELEAKAAVRMADLLIVPVRPPPNDFEVVSETLKILRRLIGARPSSLTLPRTTLVQPHFLVTLSLSAPPNYPIATYTWTRCLRGKTSPNCEIMLP